MNVLVVENIAGQQSALCESLRRQEHAVERVCDQREAVARARQKRYDLIILDLAPAIDSSLLVLHQIREFERDCEIIVLSTPEQIGERVTALIQGADDYLVKPFSLQQLNAQIESLRERRAAVPAALRSSRGRAVISGRDRHLDEHLLQQCRGENPSIELIISEVKLADLLSAASTELSAAMARRDQSISLPGIAMPTILSDACWMEKMLVNLIGHVLEQSASGANIELRLDAGGENLALVVDSNEIAGPAGGKERAQPGAGVTSNRCERPRALALASFCADVLNLRLQGPFTSGNRLRFRVSNIRIV